MAATKKKKSKSKKTDLPRLLAATALFGFAAGMLMLSWLRWGLPALDEARPLSIKPSVAILASDGALIARYGGMKGEDVRLKDLPPHVARALLAIEDRRFYRHFGLDPLGLARAMLTNIKAMRWAQGGSTITQQLAKNLFLTPDKTLRRKGQEALMALMIERKFSKDAILEAYLNRVYFGSGAYGIEAAARTYFGKSARDLTLFESAVLAGLLKAPSRYSPYAHPDLALDRARVVVRAMRETGYIDAKTEKWVLAKKKIDLAAHASGDLGRYFADWVVGLLDAFMSETSSDIVVRTTFVPKLQLAAERTAEDAFKAIKPKDNISQVALVAQAPDGAVLAMIGGRDYGESQFNRATQGLRQPGSAFKPFVYLAALEAGFSPADAIVDEPFRSGKYRPDNYDGQYRGLVPMRDALAFSLNTATVRLLDTVGTSRLIDVAKRAGIGKGLRPELASALGVHDVSPLALTNAYAVLSSGGLGVWPYAILSVEDSSGALLYRRDGAEFSRVFAENDVAALDSMLAGVVGYGTGQGAALSTTRAAGKTGTTQNYRDAWFVGYAGNVVAGVWMGNDDGAPMTRISGGGPPARLWRAFMEEALRLPLAARRPAASHAAAVSSDGPDDSFRRFIQSWTSGDVIPDDTPVYNR
jgi:penicillin-binding protein 1A